MNEQEIGTSVFVHWIYNRGQKRDNYVTSLYLHKIKQPIRLFDGNKFWRNLQPFEVPIYTFMIEKYIDYKLLPFKNKIYNFIDFSGQLRVFDDRPKAKIATSGSIQNRGKICEGYSERDLLEIMKNVGYPIPNNGFPDGTTIEKLCEIFQSWMAEKGLVFDYRTMGEMV